MGRSNLSVHLGVSMALAAATVVGIGVVQSAGAAGAASSFVPITPCRLMDTRPAPDNIGTRSTPIGPAGTYDALVWGTNGNCTIPTTATAVSMNVTAIAPTDASFLTVFPSDAAKPLAASLNWVAGQPPTPNAVTTTLSGAGRVSLFNLAGNVDLTVDIVGYYQPADLPIAGPPGPAGGQGAAGTAGAAGATGAAGPVGGRNRLTPAQIAAKRWDLDPGRPTTVQAGDGPGAIAFDGSSIWVANELGHSVTRIDPATGAVTATIPIGTGGRPSAIAWAAGRIWVADAVNKTLVRINPARSAVTATIPLGAATPFAIAFDGTRILVSNDNGTVTKVDPVANVVTGVFTVASINDILFDIVYDGTATWVVDATTSKVHRVDSSLGSVEAGITVAGGARTAATDGTHLWVTTNTNGTLVRIDPNGGVLPATVTATVTGLTGASDVVYDGTYLWVTTIAPARLVRVNPATLVVTAADQLALSVPPSGLAFDGTNLWGSAFDSDFVVKLLPF